MKFQKAILYSLLSVVLVSCGQKNSNKPQGNGNQTQGGGGAPDHGHSGNGGPVTTQPAQPYKETKEEDITRECSAAEVATVKVFEQLVKESDALITSSKGQKDDQTIAFGIKAIQACDGLIAQLGAAGACRWNRFTPSGVLPNFYDQYRVDQKCQKTDSYLTRYEARPSKETPPPVTTPEPQPPVVVTPTPTEPPVVTPPTSGTLRQCTADEFSKLSEGLGQNDKANAFIAKQGDFNNWKYDGDTIASAALAAKACESLMAYHDKQPCQQTVTSNGAKVLRQYDNATLRQRCEKARSYFYEFVQNKTTLNFKNADLYLDLSGFTTKSFEPEYVNVIQGCRIENTSGQEINYTQQSMALIKASRGFESKMMVLETAEGLLVQCYGLNIDGPFSKREIVKVLKDEGTNMPLVYRLK